MFPLTFSGTEEATTIECKHGTGTRPFVYTRVKQESTPSWHMRHFSGFLRRSGTPGESLSQGGRFGSISMESNTYSTPTPHPTLQARSDFAVSTHRPTKMMCRPARRRMEQCRITT